MNTQIATISRNSREKIVFSMNKFKGKNYLDMRLYLVGEDGSPEIPTKKGLTLAVDLYPKFKESLVQIEAAMIEAGWLGREDLAGE